MNAISIFAADAVTVSFQDKKGRAYELSAEGALFKGGAALAQLKDMTMRAAGDKAANGKYRAAADIIAAAFPSVAKGFEKIVGTPWANKSSMQTYLAAIERAEPGKNGYTAKQLQARDFVRALRTIPALTVDVSEAVTIDAPALRRAA
jgi:hypothetical protein